MAFEILAYEQTDLGLLCLRRRNLVSQPDMTVTEVTLNHEFLMSSYLTESERALTTMGLDRIATESNEKSVLVGGLGLGYTAYEALKSDRVSRVDVVEFLPAVIGWVKDDLIPLAGQLKSDNRLNIMEGDIYLRLTSPATDQFDLVVIDVDHSPEDVLGGQSHGFYSEDGLRRARNHLYPGGVLGVWSYAEDSPLRTNMQKVFANVDVEPVTVWNDLINVEQTDWLFFGRREGNQ